MAIRVAVAGANSMLAPAVIKHLLAASASVTLLVRQGSKTPPNIPSAVQIISVHPDFSTDAVTPILKGHQVVVSLVGGPAISTQQRQLIDAAADAGVGLFIPSHFGSDSTPATRVEIPTFADKHSIEEYLETKPASGMSWSSLSNGPLWEFCMRVGFLGIQPAKHTAKVLGDGNLPFATSSLDFVGQTVAAMVRQPEIVANRVVVSYEVRTTQNKIIQEFEPQTGQPFQIDHEDPQSQHDQSLAALKAGNRLGMYGLIYNVIITQGDYQDHPDRVDQQLGLKTRSLSELVAAFLAQQTEA